MAINSQRSYASSASAAQIDEGLRQYMLRIYNYMSLGVAFTAVVTLFMALNPVLMQAIFVGPIKWVLFIGLIGLGWMAPKIIMSRSSVAAHACFWSYALLWGLLISPMISGFLNLPGGVWDIARAFFITSGMFAGASLYGYVTKRNLSSFGRFFMMASIGLLIALVANIFIGSGLLSLGLSVGVVLLFAGITAYETQAIRRMYSHSYGDETLSRLAIFGAFILYGSFITMFIHVLNIIGLMRGE